MQSQVVQVVLSFYASSITIFAVLQNRWTYFEKRTIVKYLWMFDSWSSIHLKTSKIKTAHLHVISLQLFLALSRILTDSRECLPSKSSFSTKYLDLKCIEFVVLGYIWVLGLSGIFSKIRSKSRLNRPDVHLIYRIIEDILGAHYTNCVLY